MRIIKPYLRRISSSRLQANYSFHIFFKRMTREKVPTPARNIHLLPSKMTMFYTRN